jgi:hypothetical protein
MSFFWWCAAAFVIYIVLNPTSLGLGLRLGPADWIVHAHIDTVHRTASMTDWIALGLLGWLSASSAFLSHQFTTSHQSPTSSIFISHQFSTSHQPAEQGADPSQIALTNWHISSHESTHFNFHMPDLFPVSITKKERTLIL